MFWSIFYIVSKSTSINTSPPVHTVDTTQMPHSTIACAPIFSAICHRSFHSISLPEIEGPTHMLAGFEPAVATHESRSRVAFGSPCYLTHVFPPRRSALSALCFVDRYHERPLNLINPLLRTGERC